MTSTHRPATDVEQLAADLSKAGHPILVGDVAKFVAQQLVDAGWVKPPPGKAEQVAELEAALMTGPVDSVSDMAERLVAAGWTRPLPILSRLKADRDRAVRQAQFYRERLERLADRIDYEVRGEVDDILRTDIDADVVAVAQARGARYVFEGGGSATWTTAQPHLPVVGDLFSIDPVTRD